MRTQWQFINNQLPGAIITGVLGIGGIIFLAIHVNSIISWSIATGFLRIVKS